MEKVNGKEIIPILKWAGGKRWFVARYQDLFPRDFDRYIEPFFGSGAVFFKIKPNKATLADSNKELIEVYKAIQEDWKKVYKILKTHHKLHSKEYYYQVRNCCPRSSFSMAARFIYLNRTCWNGLYRVNLKGKFNVPVGTKTKVVVETDDFEQVSKLLKGKKLICSDFEKVINTADEGDFLFVDPPYTVKHNQNNFIKYNETLFSWKDQERLRDSLVEAKKRGVFVLVTNANHPCVRKLYRDNFELKTMKRESIIAASSKKRCAVEELLIKSY